MASADLSVDMKAEKCVNLRKKRDARKARGHMAKRKIPSNMQPWKANINGNEYEYQSGTTAEVPDEVAALIDFIDESAPKRDPKAAQRAIEDEVTQIVKDNFAGGVGYEETSEVVMLPETSFEVAGSEGFFQGTIGSFPYVFETGKDYSVTFDGVTNTYTAVDIGNGVGTIFNTNSDEFSSGSGWLCTAIEGVLGIETKDASFYGTHTISISRSVNIVHKIDSKFISAAGKEDMPLYVLESSKELAASKNGTALEPNELAELLKTKHCYIIQTGGSEHYMEILSYMVQYDNNVAVYVKCCYIMPSSKTILSTGNGTPPVG